MTAPTIASTSGALLIGGLVAFALSGCVNMQFAMYLRTYPRDTWQTRCLVTITWLLDIFHSILVAIGIWESIIGLNGDFSPAQRNKIPWSIAISAEIAVLMTFVTQCFFSHRIYVLHKKWMVAGPTAFLASCRLVCISVSVSELIRLGHYSLLLNPFPSWVLTLGLSLSAFTDIVITTWLCRFFRKTRKARYSATTHRILDTLTRWTLQNGLVTCAGATGSLVCWKAAPRTLSVLGIHFVMGKLYANSLVATINSRERIARPGGSTPGASNQAVILPQDFGMKPSGKPMPNRTSSPRMKPRYPIEVNVERSIMSTIDVPRDVNEESGQIYHIQHNDSKEAMV